MNCVYTCDLVLSYQLWSLIYPTVLYWQVKSAGILGMQITLASATMPRDLDSILGETISVEGFVQCTTNQLHHMLGHVSQKFIRIGHADKVGRCTLA